MKLGLEKAAALLGGAVKVTENGVDILKPEVLRSDRLDLLNREAVFAADRHEPLARSSGIGQVLGGQACLDSRLIWRGAKGSAADSRCRMINIRMLVYDTARAVFRARAKACGGGAIILEIARSEIAYTDQRPAEYVAVMIGAALREGHHFPLFIQGDHCQVNAKKYQATPDPEVDEVKKLIGEEIAAGFFNIDVDTSTLVDLSFPTLEEQQRVNFERAAEIHAVHSRTGAGRSDGLCWRRNRRGRPQELDRGRARCVHAGLRAHPR